MPNRFGLSFSRQIPGRLISCLNEGAVRYEILHESLDTAGPRPQSTILGLIQTAVVRTGNQRFLAVTSAGYDVDLKRLARLIGEPVRLETEDDFKWLFPDCALGAIPPFGNLYGLPTYVDRGVARNQEIVFSAGTCTDSIRLAYVTYTAIVKPLFGRFSVRPHEDLAR